MTPNPQQWSKLQELFHLAAETPEAERERVLAEASDDPALRRAVLELLAASPGTRQAVTADSSLPSIGPYRLIRSLGSGGTGAVYLAERSLGGGVQRCAVKVLAPHAGGRAFLERFEREQQILASLDHPYIARMLDANLGVDGQAYLAMNTWMGRRSTSIATICDWGSRPGSNCCARCAKPWSPPIAAWWCIWT